MNFLKYINQALLMLVILGGISTGCEEQKLGSYSEDYVFSISEMIEFDEQYSSFYQIVLADSVARGALNAHNPYGNGYTMFLPDNEAVEEFIRNTEAFNSLEDILANKEYVSSLIRFHVVNSEFLTSDFPYSVLTDTTASGDYISIYYTEGDTGSYYVIQNEAIITEPNIEVRNGVVHKINQMLTPVVYSGYETLLFNTGYSIFTEGLKETGLSSLMAIEKVVNGVSSRNRYTMFAEPDTMYARFGINSFEELKDSIYNRYGMVNDDITNIDNPVYQFFAYHVYEGANYTGTLFPDFANNKTTSTTILNSFGKNGMSVWANDEVIKVNIGTDTLRYEIGDDTTAVNWLEMHIASSNVVSKNGPIHKLDFLLFPFAPAASTVQFEMVEDPLLDKIKDLEVAKRFESAELEALTTFELLGAEGLSYWNSEVYEPEAYASAHNCWFTYGKFTITYTTPRILAGFYSIRLGLNAFYSNNSTVEIYVDGVKMGSTYDLASNDNVERDDPFVEFIAGSMRFNDYSTHTVTIKAITSGSLYWDYVRFVAY